MRPSSAACVVGVVLACSGCDIPLDQEFDASAPPGDDAGAQSDEDAGVAAGCDVLGAAAGATALSGAARSLALGHGGAIWVVDQATTADGGLALPASFVASASGGCGSNAIFVGGALAPSPLAPDGLMAPLDLVETSTGPALYYELFVSDATQPLGLRALGVGLAPEGATTGTFTPTSELLWSPDRPTYGGSALNVGGTVYVYGCAGAGTFTSDCFVAKADAGQLASTAAYSYWTGSGWSASPDDATSVAEGGGLVSVRSDPARSGRWLMTYVPPLGSTLVARSAIAPEGPWSAPVALATCALEGAGPGAFCSGGEQHTELVATGEPTFALTYDAATFTADAGALPGAFWPRLVLLPIPSALP